MGPRALIAALLLATLPVVAAEPCEAATYRATLVIETAPDESRALCVGFDGAEASVLDLLERSGLALRYQDFGGGNVMICSIDGVGCDYPRRECTCEFAGERRFWGMYLRDGERWTFAQTGAAQTPVRDGSVVGWRWGQHDGEDDPPGYDPSKRCEDATTKTVAASSGSGRGGLLVAGAIVVALLAGAFALRARASTGAQA